MGREKEVGALGEDRSQGKERYACKECVDQKSERWEEEAFVKILILH